MALRSFMNTLLLCALSVLASATPAAEIERRDALSSCSAIGKKISASSKVIYLLSLDFQPDIHHYFGTSAQEPTCVLEVGSDKDLSVALNIIAQNKTPFALQSGGHASNPGFSSTKGVHISFQRMKQINLSPDKSKVTLGMGLTWKDVYAQLDPAGVSVTGGRVPGPGVGGFTLGGGYSWKTNQYGLTVDTVDSFNLVLPNSTITTVDSSKPDLFFALKGGMNRFGAVTSATYITHPQVPTIYGGIVIYTGKSVQQVVDATAKFNEENKDPKAQIITTLQGAATGTSSIVLFFYDGPSKPDAFKTFDTIISTVDTRKKQSFSDFVSSVPSLLVQNPRGTFHTFSTSSLTPRFVNAVLNETNFYGKQMLAHGATTVSHAFEPFSSDFGRFDTGGAYPHANSPLPLFLYFAWTFPADDEFWYAAMRNSAARLKQIAIEEGISPSDLASYPNYAITGTSAEELYGTTNAARLKCIRDQIDPSRVMDLAGGFAI